MRYTRSYAPGVTLVGIEDQRNYMSGIRLPGSALAILPTLLAGRQGELEAFLKYSIEADQPPITETVSVNRQGRLLTSMWPVAEVISVATGDGVPLTAGSSNDGTTYTFTGDGDWLINGQIYDATGYTVTYRPGLPPNPLAMAKVKIMQVVQREVVAFHDDSRDNDSTPNGRRRAAPAPGWQRGEMRSFSRWKRRTVWSRPNDFLPGVAPDYYAQYGAGTEIGGVYTMSNPAAFYDQGDARRIDPGA